MSSSGNIMEGNVVLEYKLYIYTAVNDSDSPPLNDTITNVVSKAVEEKLEATLESLSISGMYPSVNYFRMFILK